MTIKTSHESNRYLNYVKLEDNLITHMQTFKKIIETKSNYPEIKNYNHKCNASELTDLLNLNLR